VGGATGLATGSLEKGLMAGLGAYGGAGLESGLNAAGNSALETASSAGAGKGAFLPGAETAPSSTLDRLQAGIGAYGKAPYDALKDNAMNLGLASAPLLAGSFDDQQTNAPKQQVGNRYMYKVDPLTGQSYAYKTYTGDEIKDSPPVRFGNANGGLIQHYDDGGTVPRDFLKDPVRFGNVTAPVDINGKPIVRNSSDTRSDSQKAEDYLMGKGPNPFLFYHKPTVADPIKKAAEATKTLQEEIKQEKQGGGGGNKSFDAGSGSASTSNPFKYDPNSLSGGIVHALLNPIPNDAPIVDTTGYSSVAEAEAAGLQKLANQYGMYNNPQAGVIKAINNTDFSGMDRGSVSNAPSTPATKEVQDRINNTDFSGMDRNSTSNESSGRDPSGEAHDSRDAQGGFLNHGRFDQRYADGGATGSGSIDLHVPINLGGGQGGGMGGGLGSLGGGFGGGNGIQQGGMPQSPMGSLGGLDPKAIAANPQGFSNWLQGAMNQEQARPGSTMLSGASSTFGGGMGGMRGGSGPQNNMFAPMRGMAEGGITALADGGMYNLGSYSDGGRLLRGPGDGVSDDIPATIGENQPARLADGEFVVPARIVSELGNGSTEAGARKLYAMMDRVQKSRSKTTGKDRVATNTRADKYLPA
jgi:hypothetical protein